MTADEYGRRKRTLVHKLKNLDRYLEITQGNSPWVVEGRDAALCELALLDAEILEK